MNLGVCDSVRRDREGVLLKQVQGHMGKHMCASSLFWSSIMVGNTNINSIVVRQRNMSPKAAYGNVCSDIIAQHTLLNGGQSSKQNRGVQCLFPQLQTPLLCSALWCGNWFDSHFFPPASWILDSAKRGHRKSTETGAASFQRCFQWLDWIKIENNDNRNGEKTRSLYRRVSKMEPKTPQKSAAKYQIL